MSSKVSSCLPNMIIGILPTLRAWITQAKCIFYLPELDRSPLSGRKPGNSLLSYFVSEWAVAIDVALKEKGADGFEKSALQGSSVAVGHAQPHEYLHFHHRSSPETAV